jgi:hypothetical protein
VVGNIVTRVPCGYRGPGQPRLHTAGYSLAIIAAGLIKLALCALAIALAVSGCGGDPASPAPDGAAPVIDIAQLPDIDQTTDQMLDLIEQVRAQVTRLVPATDPWDWTDQQLGMSCVQEKTDRKGVMRGLRDLVSRHELTDDEWDRVFPGVRQLAMEAGLNKLAAPQSSDDTHNARFTSDDGRTLVFISRGDTMITGNIACRVASGPA